VSQFVGVALFVLGLVLGRMHGLRREMTATASAEASAKALANATSLSNSNSSVSVHLEGGTRRDIPGYRSDGVLPVGIVDRALNCERSALVVDRLGVDSDVRRGRFSRSFDSGIGPSSQEGGLES